MCMFLCYDLHNGYLSDIAIRSDLMALKHGTKSHDHKTSVRTRQSGTCQNFLSRNQSKLSQFANPPAAASGTSTLGSLCDCVCSRRAFCSGFRHMLPLHFPSDSVHFHTARNGSDFPSPSKKRTIGFHAISYSAPRASKLVETPNVVWGNHMAQT